MTRFLSPCLLLAGVSLFAPGPARAEPADPFAFITQEVCVDAADKAVAGDPAHCPRTRRLRVGEPIPYLRVDAGNWQAFYAYPVASPGGQPRAMVAKVFGGNDTSGSYGDLGARSGFDLLEIHKGLLSGIRTSDGGAGDQIFWRSADCARTNGWIFFPVNIKPGESGELQSTLKITKGPSIACPHDQLRNIAPDDTVWERPVAPFRYTSGKQLDSIISMHFAYGDPENPAHTNDSMEKFYFTKPYGYTRWEAWETVAGCNARAAQDGKDPAELCRPYPPEHCSGPNTQDYFGKPYIRLDCRDVSFIVADADRRFYPLTSDAAPGDVLSRNLLRNGTFFDGLSGWTAGPGSRAEREPRINNAVAALSAGGTLRQDFAIPPEAVRSIAAGDLRVGLTLLTDAAGGRAHVVLVLERPGGSPLRLERDVDATGAGLKTLRAALPADDGAGAPTVGHLEISLDKRAGARIDDAFVAVLPAQSADE